jgi:Uma2 family endonuclease
MVDTGVFDPEARLELVEGRVVEMTPQSSRHAAAVQLVERALVRRFGSGYSIRVQMPLALGPDSAPEPDLAVVPGTPRDHRDAHPDHASLIVEVADSSLAHDRETKSRLYARSRVPEYWIVNLIDSVVEVQREPSAGAYRSASSRGRGETVGDSIRVDDLLP